MKRLTALVETCIRALVFALAVSTFSAGQAQSAPDPDEVLVENRWTKITRAEYEAELLRLPADIRGGFGVSAKRVTDLLTRLLVTKTLAIQARAGDLYKDAEAQRRRALEIDRVDAGVLIAKIEEDAGKEFDARKQQFEARALELYLASRESKYRVPEQVAASHILFDTKKRSKEDALKLAEETRARIMAGADFNELARQVSDDPSAARNAGHIDYFDRKQMDPAFSDAAFGLKNVGDVSEPVLSSFGYHLIRLDGRKPARAKSFEDVRGEIMAQERARFITEKREEALATIRDDPLARLNQKAVDALVVTVNPEVVKKTTETPQPK
jgi:parvulin-like peptidyl-prolyl isomerase